MKKTKPRKPAHELVGWRCSKCQRYYRRYGIDVHQHLMICQPEKYHPWKAQPPSAKAEGRE